MKSDKIKQQHLERKAYVYVRQSSHYQVENNLESQRLQYDLIELAKDYGFTEVVVIDRDLGVSADGYSDRQGFKELITAISLNLVGIVFGLETARLARNGRDWHHLLEICALFDTLIVEKQEVYDPANPNDRMMLAMKGTMSEMELAVMKGRLLEGARNKAKRGELIYRLPIGLIKTQDNRIEKDPNKRIQEVLEQVFVKFRETRSARQTFLWFLHESISFPAIEYGQFGKTTIWKQPVYETIWNVLKNPFYAGAYVHGRRETRKHFDGETLKKTKGHMRDIKDWSVLIKDNHPGYICWDEFEENQAILCENAKRNGGLVRGPVLNGEGLLAGLLRCRKCGRKLQVSYGGTKGKIPRYACSMSRIHRGEATCIAFGGFRVDQAVGYEVLKVVEPFALEAAFAAVEKLQHNIEEKKRLLTLELEHCLYEERRAYKQYNSVDPENRLVCDQLESKWNVCLEKVDHVKRRLSDLDQSTQPISTQTKHVLFQLADDLPELWNAPSTTPEMRKRIIRTVIKEIVVDVDEVRSMIVLTINWVGGAHTTLEVKRNKIGVHRNSADKSIVEIVAQLAQQLPDQKMAPILNRLGLKTGAGNSWTRSRICSLRNHNGITAYQAHALHDMLTLEQASTALGICAQSVKSLIDKGLISARQVVAYAPWAIPAKELEKKIVKQAVDDIKRGENRRNESSPNQTQLFAVPVSPETNE
jgi:DNA invertase Pin-like site-specific DNA recombinase